MKWINRTLISTVIVLLIVTVAVLVAVLGFYTTGGKMEVGSWADWVSATANIVMAGAAFYAALNAKDWINEKKADKAFELAEILVSEKIPATINQLTQIDSCVQVINSYVSFKENSNLLIENIDMVLNNYKKHVNKLFEHIESIYTLENKLAHHGWKLKKEFEIDSNKLGHYSYEIFLCSHNLKVLYHKPIHENWDNERVVMYANIERENTKAIITKSLEHSVKVVQSLGPNKNTDLSYELYFNIR
ncbi:hypothetical protein WCT87_12220 [Pectobacterium brasiliense]|uniref:hypothetical protein n=1 Tax=Pectobacterium brasiliense TaxID=180957 RepID=UPI0030185674